MSMDTLKVVAYTLAGEFDMSPQQFISDLFRDELPARGGFTDLALAFVWPRGRGNARRFSEFLTSRIAHASTVVWREPFIPNWLAPDTLMLLNARCSQGGALNIPELRTKLALARPVRELLLGGGRRPKTLVPMLRSEIATVTSGAPPFEALASSKAFELVEEITGNAVAIHGTLPVLVEDADESFPDGLRSDLARSQTIIAIDDRILVKRWRGSVAWLIYDRADGAATARFIDSELKRLAELLRFVRHEQTGDAIIRELNNLLDRSGR